MKAMKQNQFHGFPTQGAVEQSRFYQNSSSHSQGQSLNQGAYFNNQVAKQHEAFRNPGQNQGTHYVPKEWRPFNQPVQYHNWIIIDLFLWIICIFECSRWKRSANSKRWTLIFHLLEMCLLLEFELIYMIFAIFSCWCQ